jgi:hypothetical protein
MLAHPLSKLIDVIEGDRAYIPGSLLQEYGIQSNMRQFYLNTSSFNSFWTNVVLYVFNKIDSLWIEELDILDRLDKVVPSKSTLEIHAMHVTFNTDS